MSDDSLASGDEMSKLSMPSDTITSNKIDGIFSHPYLITASNYFYQYFFRYFLDQEVGHFWSVLNGMTSTFFLGFIVLWLMKGWGLTAWNRNLIKNKKRLLGIAFRRLREELEQDGSEEKAEKRLKISLLDFHQLRDALQSGKISAEDSVDAFRWKALQCHEKYNCVTEFIKEAMDWARQLDSEYKNKPKPPLFGMPFSVKDNFYITGYDSTIGLAKNIENPAQCTASLVEHLQSLGAVPIVKTNVPQTMLSFACSNLIFGTTENPHKSGRSPGGSSGGEACIVAAGGCSFGIGTDLAGSLRIPAHFCGVVSLKPTESRLTVCNVNEGVPGAAKISLSCGFFTKDVESQIFLLSVTLNDSYFKANPLTVPMQFDAKACLKDKKSGNGALRIGYYEDDGFLETTPPCRRAVLEAIKTLKGLGHVIVPFDLPRPHDAFRLVVKTLFADNGYHLRKGLEYEDIDPTILTSVRLLKLPHCIRSLAGRLVASKWPEMSTAAGAYVKNLADLRWTFALIKEYRQEFINQWQDLDLDVLVCPAFCFPAISHQFAGKVGAACFTTALYNVLDFPAGTLPVTHVNDDDEQNLTKYPENVLKGHSTDTFTIWDHPVYSVIRQATADSQGLPVGVQVVAMPYREEICLKVMSMLEKA